ncbi:MAG: IS1595 family transposase [Gammaproteobacteria bacterium]
MNLTDPIYTNESKARAHLEALRWPDGPVCPHCGVIGNAVRLAGESTRPGLYKCRDCRLPFSVTVGTVFERSKIPLHKWLLAAHLMASSKKGFSAHQLHRAIKVTYKTAWFMMHRLREAMTDTDSTMLGGPGSSGIVEADEVYLGKAKGQGKGAHYASKQKVVALVERKGRVRAFHVPTVNVHTVKEILKGQVAESARLMTDSAGIYKKVGKQFASHETVNHLAGEYARGDVTTNTVEGYFGILQRGLRGIYQHVSPAHLHRYVNEFSFRYNNRSSLGVEDAERAARLLVSIAGKRLTYRRSDATA